jgi:hypothetical protein
MCSARSSIRRGTPESVSRRIPDIRYPHEITAAKGVFRPGVTILCGKLAQANMLPAKHPRTEPAHAISQLALNRFTPIP